MLPANACIITRWQGFARVTQPRVTKYVGRYPAYNPFLRLYAHYHTFAALSRLVLCVSVSWIEKRNTCYNVLAVSASTSDRLTRFWRTLWTISFVPYTVQWGCNLLKPKTLRTTSFNRQKFCVLPTLYLCVLRGSQNKQQLFLYAALTYRFL
jgi:hypothetical protein